ncbi:MAG: hypothetical protein GX774_19440 [Armatimonadetes bacterium]|jgi:hypothetical protein|nr:hypothetical protein [Armatimonadota bacterium]
MPKYRAQVPYIDDMGRERLGSIEVEVRGGDPDELAQAAVDEWEKRHPERAGIAPEDLAWEQVEDEE